MESTSLTAYLTSLQNLSEQDKELTHCAKLESLLENLAQILSSQRAECKNIKIIHQPPNNKEGKGAPDFLITKDSLVLGYVENKRVNAKLDEVAQSPQIRKYFTLSPNIILTDYLRFCLLHQDDKGAIHIERECKICELSELKAIVKNPKLCDLDSKASELIELFALFFTRNPKPINTAKEFANALALRTRILKDELESNENNRCISAVFYTFKNALYKELNFKEFADSFAQTLTYSLFLSRLNSPSDKEIDIYNVKRFVPKSFPLIRDMSGFLDNLEDLDSIKWLIEEMINIINHIDIGEIFKDLNKGIQKDLFGEYMYKDPYIHFYEDFLASYDPKLRELRGVYYTPAPVVEFIIDSIDLLLQKDFKKQGLKAAMSDEKITLLDFATGTGTFLLQALRKALESSDKGTPSFVLKPLLQRFYGFEFLIAPYTIAHLKISQALKEEFHISLNDNESLNIMLTNTLYSSSIADEKTKKNTTENYAQAGAVELAREFEKAQSIKEQNILIITGNPPYSGASANKGLYEDEVRISYGLEPSLAELSENEQKQIATYLKRQPENREKQLISTFKTILDRHKLQNEKNPKWLLDDYVKFIRFAERKIENQGGGIFAFISNNGFLDNPTFRGMRYHLLNTFDTLYILDLHGSTRKKETTPNGEKDDNVFDIQQGVSINIFVKSTPRDKVQVAHKQTKTMDCHEAKASCNDLATIYHYDLYGKRKDKYRFLKETSLDSIPWQTLKPQAPYYLFIPQDEKLKAEYDKGWSVKDIFKVSGVGICSKRDSIVFHNSKESLKTMLQDFITKPQETLRKEYNIGEDSRDWKLESAIESIKENKDNLENFIHLCHYRPFDYRYTYYINKSRAFMAYPVYDIFQHFLEDFENMALISNRSVALNEFHHSFITGDITDLHILETASASAYASPLYVKDSVIASERSKRGNPQTSKKLAKNADKSAYNDDIKWVENFTPEFREFIDSKYSEHFSPEQIMGYIYAVLFHKEYREKYLDFLKIDFPKIPFVESKELFVEFSTLGQELLRVHLMADNERERERETRRTRE